MTDMNLNELTVLELRKVAKEMKVPLGAGISKQGIIDKLTSLGMSLSEKQKNMLLKIRSVVKQLIFATMLTK